MVETPDVPTIARVMRVQPRPDEQPATGFSWGDYEDVEESRATADDADGEDEGGWVVKGSRTRTRMSRASPCEARLLTVLHRNGKTHGTALAGGARIFDKETAAESSQARERESFQGGSGGGTARDARKTQTTAGETAHSGAVCIEEETREWNGSLYG